MNRQWEDILQEVEQQLKDEEKGLDTRSDRTHLASKKPTEAAKKPKSESKNALNMIDYYKDQNMKEEGERQSEVNRYLNDPQTKGRSVNDIIFTLLLLGKHNMHMNVISDYEIKQ